MQAGLPRPRAGTDGAIRHRLLPATMSWEIGRMRDVCAAYDACLSYLPDAACVSEVTNQCHAASVVRAIRRRCLVLQRSIRLTPGTYHAQRGLQSAAGGSNMAGIIIAVIVIVVVLIIVFAVVRRRQTDTTHSLRGRFGPEYDRTVEQTGDQSKAERELKERQKRVSSLELQPLSDQQRQSFSD